MIKMVYGIILSLGWAAGLGAQGGPGDSTAGYLFLFTDNDSDGVNDLYLQDAAGDSSAYANNPSFNLQYKYEFGLGYGYGFSDADQNGTNDLVDNAPGLADLNPTINRTRLEGLETIKRGILRHGKEPVQVLPGQREKDHVLHDGHCKDEARYNFFRNSPDGN